MSSENFSNYKEFKEHLSAEITKEAEKVRSFKSLTEKTFNSLGTPENEFLENGNGFISLVTNPIKEVSDLFKDLNNHNDLFCRLVKNHKKNLNIHLTNKIQETCSSKEKESYINHVKDFFVNEINKNFESTFELPSIKDVFCNDPFLAGHMSDLCQE